MEAFNPRHTTRLMPPSLLAEELDRDPLDAQRAFYEGLATPQAPMALGWNLIETGLQRPATDGDYVDQGFSMFVTAKDAGELSQQDAYRLRLAIASRRGFYERLDGKVPDDSLFDHTYRKVGRVLRFITLLDLPPSQEKGQLSELIALESLLRAGRYFPWVSSLREEASRDRRRNHDCYILGHYDGYMKLGFSIKSDIAPGTTSPAAPLRMGPIIDAAVQADEDRAAWLEQFPTNEMHRLESYRWLAALFLKDHGPERLTSSERAVLNRLGNMLNAHVGQYLEPAPTTTPPYNIDNPT